MTGIPDIVVFILDTNGSTRQTLQKSSFNTIHQNVYPSVTIDSQSNCLVAYYSIDPGSGPGDETQELVIFKLRNQVCVSGETLIRLAGGSNKEIRSLQRGDVVAPHHIIARVCQEPIDPSSPIDLMVFDPGCLGHQQPKQRLVMTPNHPIFYHGARRPAKCFEQCHGVHRIHCSQLASMMDLLDGHPCLYDLQFDHEGSYWANGLEIQSRSPYSYWGPLPKECYYDQSLYTDDRVWDSTDASLPLDESPIRLNQVILRNKCHQYKFEGHPVIHNELRYPQEIAEQGSHTAPENERCIDNQ
jgi:hypothetical protein